MSSVSDYRQFLRHAEQMRRIYESDLDWETKFEVIFGIYRETPITLKWYDPDMDYEDDVRAFMDAVREAVEKAQKIVEIAEGPMSAFESCTAPSSWIS